MRKWAWILVLMMWASCAWAQEPALDVEARRAEVIGEPWGLTTLNMEHPFEPISMTPKEFKRMSDEEKRAVGLMDEYLPFGWSGEWTEEDGSDTCFTVLYYGEMNAGYCAVFEKQADGQEKLIDILYSISIASKKSQIVHLSDGRYLLTTSYGHGTGTFTLWTNFYNLDRRCMELSIPRKGYESHDGYITYILAHTNIDSPLDDYMDAPEELMVYLYTTIKPWDEGPNPTDIHIVDNCCTVRRYCSSSDGLWLIEEKVFPGAYPAAIEQKRSEEIHALQTITQGEQKPIEHQEGGLETYVRKNLPVLKVVETDWVNIRKEPDKQSESIGVLEAGETAYMLADGHVTNDGWTHVVVLPEGGTPCIGYVWCRFVQPE